MRSDELRAHYQDNVGRAERLREAVVSQLSELLTTNEITLGVPMESRVKSLTSIEEKSERKRIELTSIFELQDLVGVRCILLFRSDLDRVTTLIKKHFDLISAEDTSERLSDSEFGYQSQHFVVRLPKSWLSLPSLSNLSDFSVELQVRTLAQHIWAAASHKLQYKQEAGVPPPLRRAINRASALLETVDLEFERVLDARRAYVEATHITPASDAPLNVDSLAATLSELLPPENKKEQEPYADLLLDMNELGVLTPTRLHQLLSKHMDKIKKSDAERANEIRSGASGQEPPDVIERVARGVFYAHVGLAREALRAEFGEKEVSAVMRKRMPAAKQAGKRAG